MRKVLIVRMIYAWKRGGDFMRTLAIFEHTGDCISIYYYREGSNLARMLERLLPKRIYSYEAERVPSYVIYDGLITKLRQFYANPEVEPFAVNHFRDGFSFIAKAEVKDWVLAYLKGLPYDEKESYDYRSSHIRTATLET